MLKIFEFVINAAAAVGVGCGGCGGGGGVVFHSRMCSESSHAVVADVTQVAMRCTSSNLHFNHRPSPVITPNMSNITHH